MNEKGGRTVLASSIALGFVMVLIGRTLFPVPLAVYALHVIALCLYSGCWFAEARYREALYRIAEVVQELAYLGTMIWLAAVHYPDRATRWWFLGITAALSVFVLALRTGALLRELRKLRIAAA